MIAFNHRALFLSSAAFASITAGCAVEDGSAETQEAVVSDDDALRRAEFVGSYDSASAFPELNLQRADGLYERQLLVLRADGTFAYATGASQNRFGDLVPSTIPNQRSGEWRRSLLLRNQVVLNSSTALKLDGSRLYQNGIGRLHSQFAPNQMCAGGCTKFEPQP